MKQDEEVEQRGWSPKQAAKYLGLSASFLAQDRMRDKRIPFVKAARRVLYLREDLDSWLIQNRIEGDKQ